MVLRMFPMKALVVMVMLAACGDNQAVVTPDAPEAPADGGNPNAPDFYGEACPTPSTPLVASICRRDAPYPNAFCTFEGVCRPWCDHVKAGNGYIDCRAAGGVEIWTGPSRPGADRGFCYCEKRI